MEPVKTRVEVLKCLREFYGDHIIVDWNKRAFWIDGELQPVAYASMPALADFARDKNYLKTLGWLGYDE